MFSTMLDLTTTPATCSNSTIWQWVNTYLLPDIANHSNNFTTSPIGMQHFSIDATVRHITTITEGAYYLYGYINALQYHAHLGALVLQRHVMQLEEIQVGACLPLNVTST